MNKIKIKLRKPENSAIFHDSRGDAKICMEAINICIDKINEIVELINDKERTEK